MPTLEALLAAGHEIPLVVTQPDRPVGSRQATHRSTREADAFGRRTPRHPAGKDPRNNVESARRFGPCPGRHRRVAYARIVPPWMLALPRLGLHQPSRVALAQVPWRGAHPMGGGQGENGTGNTTMLLEEGLDTGPILLQQPLPIRPDQDADGPLRTAGPRGRASGGGDPGRAGQWNDSPQPQDHALATLRPILTREEGRMDLAARTAANLLNRWRGFQPWPGAFTALDGKKLIVHRMAPVAASAFKAPASAQPGQIHIENHRLFAACAQNTWLELLEIQLEGKKRMSAAEFLRGNQLSAARLG